MSLGGSTAGAGGGVPHPPEEETLQTLASIKTQVSSLLLQLQEAKVSAAVAAAARMDVSNVGGISNQAEMKKAEGPPDTPLSRDDVKAQREAKKAAKAARKNKGGGEATQATEEGMGTPKSVPQQPKKPSAETKNIKTEPKKQQQLPSQNQQKENKTPPKTPTKPTTATGNDVWDAPKGKSEQSQGEHDTEDKEKKEEDTEPIHPKFRELGLKFSEFVIRGSNQRTVALLQAVKNFITGYRTPEGKGFKQDISSQLQIQLRKLEQYRPYAVGMTNAVESFNAAIRALEEGLSDSDYKEELIDWCDRFVDEKIIKAVESIAQKAAEKIQDNDTILCYSLTDAIYHTFKLAGKEEKKIHLILAITTKPAICLSEYKKIRSVMDEETFASAIKSVRCIPFSGIMSFIPSVDKVFLGGHALFTTGAVMAHAGSSSIALCANSHNVPVIFFCETFKFCDKSPTDAFYSDVFPENKFSFPDGKDLQEGVFEAQINYDVTPANLVTCVITDIDMLPSSSVPVVLRVQENRPLTK